MRQTKDKPAFKIGTNYRRTRANTAKAHSGPDAGACPATLFYHRQPKFVKKIILLFIFLSASFNTTAQKRFEDSIKNIIAHAKNDTIKIRQYFRLATYYLDNKPDSGVVYGEKIIQLGKKTLNSSVIDQGMYVKGYSYYNAGNYSAALKLDLKVLQDFEKDTNKTRLANVYNMTGNIYKGQQNYPKALYYYRLCKTLAEREHDATDYAFALMNISFVDDQLDLPDSAIYYSNKFINYKAFKGRGDFFPFVYNTLGEVYFKQKKFNIAYANYHKGFILARNSGNLSDESKNARGLSQYYKRSDNTDSALFYADIAVKVSHASGYKLDIFKSALLLAGIYESGHRLDSAYKYLKISMAVNDSLYNAQKVQDFANATTDESLRQDAIKSAVKEYNEKLRNYAFIGVIAVVLLIAFFLWRNSQNQKRAYNLLSTQKRETDIQKAATDEALVELKSTQNQLIQSEKMASLGALTAGIAHEIQNPLNFVNNFSEVSKELMEELDEELEKGNVMDTKAITTDVIANLGMIHHHGKRADSIVKGMLEHSRTSTGKREPTDINKLADEYLRLAYHGLRAKDKSFNADLETNFDPALPLVPLIPQDIGRVMLNLFNNAFYAVRQKHGSAAADYKPTVTVNTSATADVVEIVVKDNGTGIPEANLNKIMQPFFTTKPTGEGIGLGLSLSYDIVVKGHNGKISVNSNPGEGAEFIVKLPLS